ncbi:MAG: hypothetical protein MI810_19915, partial [Flavobacteriales bacterium]|nr:hypothetical protein [Flavobacteriales bacterium]
VGGNKFLVYQSFDKSKTMISYRCTPVNKDANVNHDIIGFYVFDEDMNKIWGDEVEMPYTEKEMNNIAYTVGSNGDAKMLITNRVTSEYELITVSGGKLSTSNLNLSAEQLVRNMKFAEDDKGNFVCGGFYANGYEFKMTFGGAAMTFNANGILYFEINSEGKVTKQKNFDFEEDFIKQNLNDRQKKAVEEREAKGKAGILDLFLTHFMVKEDGSIYIVGERQYARNEFYGPQQKMVYHFSNVIAAKLNPEGELEWMKKLPKNQAGLQGGGQMSIAYLDGKAADYVAFVDNPKNINLSAEDGIPAAHKDGLGGFLTTYKIDHEDGELEKHTILDLEKVGEYKADQ